MHWGSTDGPEEKDMNAMIPQIEANRFSKCIVQDGIQVQRQHNRGVTAIFPGRVDGKLRKRKRVAILIETASTCSGLRYCRQGIVDEEETPVRLSVGASWAHMDTRVEGLVGRVGVSPRLP
ncbi:hypothetical protein FVEG_07195 [Fusarium verticillioides 7600]|uniref:Uncharacterized protein n=1 Tax=Gibberella moniliformis (strain M3125 / FGSC 7600) TaxID=334819 RepID=W7M5T9_GIBM7|nr:hypothetical protein FVEG_07195 [Fusarium verticillioides 7600]EWG46918.1 hypothetical protein FVEG_07195 [Fusarium verticillioides 7600]